MTTVQRGWRTAFGNAIGESIKDSLQSEPAAKMLEAPARLGARNVEPIDVSDIQPVSMPKLDDLPDISSLDEPVIANVKVRSGDTLEKLAGTSDPAVLDKIAQYNGLKSRHEIRAGQTLSIPDSDVLNGVAVSEGVASRGDAGAKHYVARKAAAAEAKAAAAVSAEAQNIRSSMGAEALDRQANQLAVAAKWARSQGMNDAAADDQKHAEKAFYEGRAASLEAFRMGAAQQAKIPETLYRPDYSKRSFGGANASGLAPGVYTDSRSQSAIDASLDRTTTLLTTSPLWAPAVGFAATYSPLGFALGTGGDAAGQYYQNGEVRPMQSVFSGVTGSSAFSLARRLPAITSWGSGVLTVGGNATIGGATAVANTSFNNAYYQEATSLYDAGRLGAGFSVLGTALGTGTNRFLSASMSSSAYIPIKGTPWTIPAQGTLNIAPLRIGNTVSNTIGAVPAFKQLDNGLKKDGK